MVKKNEINFKKASEYKNEYIERVPSGIFSFDALTGGGLPFNKINMFYGDFSSGKTTVSLMLIGNYLKMHKDKSVLYMDFEHSFDKIWASHFIEDMERLFIIEPDYGEQGIDICIDLISNNENIGFVFVDSLAEIIPISNIDTSAVDDTVGVQARVINKLLRKLLHIISVTKQNNRKLLVLLINQVRANIGSRTFGSQTKIAGGFFQNLIASTIFKFYAKSKDTATDTKPAKWLEVSFKIEKSKISGILPYRTGVFKIQLVSDGVYNAGDIITNSNMVTLYGIKYKIINKINGKYFGLDGLTTIDKVNEYMMTYPKEYYDIYKKLVNIISKGGI